jgi:hypothetical protein
MEVLWDLVGRCSAFCPTSFVPSLAPVEVLTVNNRTYRVIKQVSKQQQQQQRISFPYLQSLHH